MKKLFVLALAGAMVLSLAACKKNETVVENASEQVVVLDQPSEVVADVTSEIVEEVVDYPDYSGTYTEPMSGRCTIEITHVEEGNYTVNGHWSSSAFESSNWEMNATYYPSTDLLEYTDAKYYVRTYTDEENFTDDVKYTDGAGEFWFDENGNLGWRSANSDVDYIDGETFFERVEITE